jgi:hypothetical protein
MCSVKTQRVRPAASRSLSPLASPHPPCSSPGAEDGGKSSLLSTYSGNEATASATGTSSALMALRSCSLSLGDEETVSSMTIDSSHQTYLSLLVSLLVSPAPRPASRRVDRKTSFLDFSSKKNTDGTSHPTPLLPHLPPPLQPSTIAAPQMTSQPPPRLSTPTDTNSLCDSSPNSLMTMRYPPSLPALT